MVSTRARQVKAFQAIALESRRAPRKRSGEIALESRSLEEPQAVGAPEFLSVGLSVRCRTQWYVTRR